ncbi:hypothetical protein PIB30_062579 [Stylosanthes scabra]|uniref:Uncharacterized protein n=1 Tax=Stylosanthes scabra TaxID=79078 RepID=A0ABU6RLA8_9FABA|nr:hypothetical protein [Stylosanthes scabra]
MMPVSAVKRPENFVAGSGRVTRLRECRGGGGGTGHVFHEPVPQGGVIGCRG